MQRQRTCRFLAWLLTVAMVLGLVPAIALARTPGDDGSPEMNEAYANQETLMPIGPSFNVDTLLEWTPESDPDAMYSRASIPLADRVGGFVVNPVANPEAKLMLCSMANTDHDNTSAQGSENFFTYAFNYWQYTDSFVYWSGSEEGLIVCPTGEFTDAAHTNGVPVVATLGFPWGSGAGYVEQVRKFLQKDEDGSFPVADKLIEVMDYYGFDGYFFNQETYGCSATEGALIDEMMRYMHKKRPDMLISWYDSMLPTGGVSYENAVNDRNKQFLTDSEDGTRAIDEFFMNYNWGESQISTTINTMRSIGRSEFDAFAGFNVQANVYGDSLRDYLLVDEDGVTRLSLALYYANQTMSLATNGEEFHETEQAYYVNAAGDPRDTSVDVTDRSETAWAGMSRFFADKTAILEAPFVTDFNTGHGRGYYVDGRLSRDAEWSYQSNQDVLPTWTWIIDSEGSKLDGAYDFSDAYNGGNSLKFFGDLSAGQANDIMLYSTKVTVEDGMNLGLTYKGDQGLMKLVAYYGDANTTSYDGCEKVEYDLTASAGDWTTTQVSLSANAGKILYAIGLKVESETDLSDYQVNLGRLTLTERTRPTLSGPAGITLDGILYSDAYTAEARIYWRAVTGASSYEIYQVNEDGTKNLIMETPNTAFYIPTLKRDEAAEDVTLEVVAINRNGERGEGTQMTIDWAYTNDDSEPIVIQEFDNVCLNATVTGYSEQGDGAECEKALDGTSANNSKWWASGAGDWMSIDVGREVTVRRWRVEHAEAGGESKDLNTDTFALEYKDSSGEWVEAMRITGNTDAITDVLLEEPVTAQEWRLVIYRCGPSPWTAVNIYEWQMFETSEFPQTEPVPMQFATAMNGAGATDTFTLTNVPVGQTVTVYTAAGDQIGQTVAEETTVTFTDLDFGTAEAGRVYYTCTAVGAAESAKLSAPFDAETAEKSAPATDVTFEKYSRAGSVSSSSGSDIYTTMTVSGLSAGDVIYVYENGQDENYTRVSMPAQGNQIVLEGVRIVRAGGTLALQVKRSGQLISDVYTVDTPAFDEPTANLVLYARNASGESLTGVVYGIYNAEGDRVSSIATTSDSGGRVALELGTYSLRCESVPEGYEVSQTAVPVILRIEGWDYPVNVTVSSDPVPAAKEELQAYYDELLANNQYSDAGEAELAAVLADGLEALDACEGSEELAATLAEAKAALDAVLTYDEELEAILAAAEAAKADAEAAQKAAEEAKAAAEAAQAAAEEAAESAAADKDAAEQAAEEAAAAQAEAEAAQKAAEAAQKAAEEAAAAAEASNLAAAEEAAKAAAEAAAAAESAADAAKYAEEAATAMRAAQAAQEAAEAAQAKAEAAQAAAEEAQKAAEEAAASTAEDKEAAEKAKAEAEAAQKAAEDAQAAAENAAAAAEESRKAAEAHDAAAAQAAADAAKYAQEVAEKYEEICAMKAEMAQYLLDAQQAAQAAEESAKAAAEAELAAAKYYALFTLATYADKNDYAEAQQVELAAAIEAGNQAINAATSVEGVEAALAAAKQTIDGIKTLADLEAEKPPFTDVAEGAWYYDAVKYVYHNGLFQGVSETIFRPESPMNRAMVVTVLHRLAGSPAAEGEIAFTDVPADQYYEEALIWAVDNGLAQGVSETAFAPTSPVTREQLVTFLYRYAEFAGMDVSGKADLMVFADSDKLSSYAEEAMAWAVDAGIIDGVGNNTLAPRNNATRAQVAAMLMRFDQLG